MTIFLLHITLLITLVTGCDGQERTDARPPVTRQSPSGGLVGGHCDGCELMYVGMPATVGSVDTSAGWNDGGQKLLVTGTIFKLDGKTPAPGVVVYYWQTDAHGYYSPRDGMPAAARRHGHIRGWVQSGDDGRYAIYTIRPGAYPDRTDPAHIHLSIKEPDISNEYYIDELVFDADPLLTGAMRRSKPNRGGSGLLRLLISGDLQVAEHNVILGLNIPNYPDTLATRKSSGLQIGEESPSFIPFHAWGPDKGSRACPVCKYGRQHGILYFIGNRPNWEEINSWLAFLERESIARGNRLKVYFVYGNENGFSREGRTAELERIGKTLGLQHVALTFVPSLSDAGTEVNLNAINPDVENTFIVFKHRTIVDKYVDLKPTPGNFGRLTATIERTGSIYDELPEAGHD